MKKIVSNYKMLVLLLLLPVVTTAADGEFTKNYHKEYDVPKDATIELINKYGFVKVHAWDKRIASIDVNILANTTNQERANEIFDRININFTTTSTYIKAETVINSSSNKNSWFDWKSWIGWNDSKSSYKINYDVYIPTDLYLKLNLKYGDAFVDGLNRDAIVKVSYGHLRMDELQGNLDLDLAYSNGNVGNIKDGKINLRYSDIHLANMQNGTLNFKYSDIVMKNGGTIKAECAYGELNADYINSMDIHSRYDEIQIDKVDEIFVNSGYSDFDLGRVGKRSSFTSTYGDIVIRDLDNAFSSMDFKTSYTDIRLNSQGAPYRLDASGNYADIKYTGDFTSTYLIDKSNSKQVKGYFKSDANSGLIRATLSYGGIRID